MSAARAQNYLTIVASILLAHEYMSAFDRSRFFDSLNRSVSRARDRVDELV